MTPERSFSARQLVMLYIAGSFVAASTFVLIGLLPIHQAKGVAFWFFVLLGFSPLALGFYITIRAQNLLKTGIDAGRFSSCELDSLRGTVSSTKWMVVAGGLLAVGCAFFYALRDTHPHASIWFFLTLAQNLIRLPSVLRAPIAASSTT